MISETKQWRSWMYIYVSPSINNLHILPKETDQSHYNALLQNIIKEIPI